MEVVSYTAQWTAAIRAKELGHGDRKLFDDDLAEAMAQPDGFELLEKYKGGGVQEFVAIRTAYNDRAVLDLTKSHGFTQIVFIAAGMDTRAFRLDWPANTRIFEVDHGALMDEKAARLQKLDAQPRADRIEVRADLALPWIDKLTDAGFDPDTKTLWIAEGLLFFLEEHQVEGLLTTLREVSAPGSYLVTDMTSKALLTSPMTMMFLATLRSDGTPWKFGTDDPAGFLEKCGWAARDVLEPGETEFGPSRWPYPVQAKSQSGVPRSWLIQAELMK
jgi:methyltransferase (TIGR00027 family)